MSPKGVKCPMELSTYFRINAENTGQFERTLIVCDEGAYVSYLEGCTAPKRDTHQLHAAVVEIVILKDAEVKYSTVQNWYPGDENGKGGIYNFVTKRADCRGDRAKVMWTQVETGSAITWKYPSCILRGDDSQGEFYSIAIANNAQQADTGTKMVHLGKRTKSRIVSKGISAGRAQNTYRGPGQHAPQGQGQPQLHPVRQSSDRRQMRGAHRALHRSAQQFLRVEHEATTSKVDDDQLFYCRSRGMDEEEAVALVVNGFCKEVLQALPMEFAMEAQSLVAISAGRLGRVMTQAERPGSDGAPGRQDMEAQAIAPEPEAEAPSFVLTFGAEESECLCRHYEAAGTILEYGSGGSTVLAAELGRTVFSVESDKAWAGRIAACRGRSRTRCGDPLRRYRPDGPLGRAGQSARASQIPRLCPVGLGPAGFRPARPGADRRPLPRLLPCRGPAARDEAGDRAVRRLSQAGLLPRGRAPGPQGRNGRPHGPLHRHPRRDPARDGHPGHRLVHRSALRP
jgi:hypothetical protein